MSTNFPSSLDSFTNPTPVSDTAIVSHASQHANINDSVAALEAKVGANSSAVQTSHDFKLSLITTTDKATPRDAAATVTNKTLGTGTKILVGADATGDTYYNGGSGTTTRSPIGSNGQVYTSNGTTPTWQSPTQNNQSYAVSTGSANAYVVTLTPALGAYVAGVLVQFNANFASTGACTVNVNGLGAKTIKKLDGATDLVTNDIKSGQIVELEYDGTNFQMLNPVANAPLTSVTDTGFLTSSAPGTTTVNTTATVLTYALAGGTLGTTKGVKIRLSGKIALSAVASSGSFTIAYGGTTIGAFSVGAGGVSTQTTVFSIDILLMGSGATNTQHANLIGISEVISGSGGSPGISSTNTTCAIDSTISQNITVSSTSNNAGVTNTFVDYFIQKII